jgi:hypothetical protein
MTSTAELPNLPTMPRGVMARPIRSVPPSLLGFRTGLTVPVTARKASGSLRKSPAWVERDL